MGRRIATDGSGQVVVAFESAATHDLFVDRPELEVREVNGVPDQDWRDMRKSPDHFKLDKVRKTLKRVVPVDKRKQQDIQS